MEKSRKRALRRWRSFHVWMRRLRRDWNEHGWNWRPLPRFMTKHETGSVWDNTDLCACFYDPRAMARFKDTPKQCT
jgi:hypothetical protein